MIVCTNVHPQKYQNATSCSVASPSCVLPLVAACVCRTYDQSDEQKAPPGGEFGETGAVTCTCEDL